MPKSDPIHYNLTTMTNIIATIRKRLAAIDLVDCMFVLYTVLALGVHCASSAQAVPWTDEEVRIARHCMNEETGNLRTCRAIVSIVTRQAAERGLTIHEFYERFYLRHQRGSVTRPWIVELNADDTTPPSWCTYQHARGKACASYEAVGSPMWQRTLATVRAVRSGQVSHGCEATPITWGGTMDTSGINSWLARGYRIISCGPTRNVFIGAGR